MLFFITVITNHHVVILNCIVPIRVLVNAAHAYAIVRRRYLPTNIRCCRVCDAQCACLVNLLVLMEIDDFEMYLSTYGISFTQHNGREGELACALPICMCMPEKN